ncbi:TPA: hypothetical protein N0F65_002878 [Lagenidium giganteum]|uniref:Elicitin-like protein n=1 Tax=Lagenidium giganteum TaxID=4803 RepID=A0AAV2ZGG6_9STRA|nr:TPA: hypothetical protein N0F65_002878 [Lagenidium giganteum]
MKASNLVLMVAAATGLIHAKTQAGSCDLIKVFSLVKPLESNEDVKSCVATTGYDLLPPPGPPSKEMIDKLCKCDSCVSAVSTLQKLNIPDCTLEILGGINVKQVVDSIAQGCAAGGKDNKPTASPSATPAPATTAPAKTPAPATTAPAPATTAPAPGTTKPAPAPATTAPAPSDYKACSGPCNDRTCTSDDGSGSSDDQAGASTSDNCASTGNDSTSSSSPGSVSSNTCTRQNRCTEANYSWSGDCGPTQDGRSIASDHSGPTNCQA